MSVKRGERARGAVLFSFVWCGALWGENLRGCSGTHLGNVQKKTPHRKTLGITYQWASVEVREFVLLLSLLLLLKFILGSLVMLWHARQSNWLPKSLQMKGAFCARWKKKRKDKASSLETKCFGKLLLPGAAALWGCFSVVLGKLSARCGNSGTMQSGVKSGHATARPIFKLVAWIRSNVSRLRAKIIAGRRQIRVVIVGRKQRNR